MRVVPARRHRPAASIGSRACAPDLRGLPAVLRMGGAAPAASSGRVRGPLLSTYGAPERSPCRCCPQVGYSSSRCHRSELGPRRPRCPGSDRAIGPRSSRG
eukprot:12097739-Alexandrium_andersonii.AAC.1